MTARATLNALAALGVDTTQISLTDLTAPPQPPRPCTICPRRVDVLVSTTGHRYVCLHCAHTITLANEQRRPAS